MEEILILKEVKGKIKEAKDIFKRIRKINIDFGQENFILICLSSSNKILKSEVLFKGGLDSCLITNQTIFKKALLSNAKKIILAHNHPSNNLKPSKEDISILNKIKEAGEILQIDILDAIIFNKKQFYSFN